jgi:hypothetical protein
MVPPATRQLATFEAGRADKPDAEGTLQNISSGVHSADWLHEETPGSGIAYGQNASQIGER